MHLLPLLLSLAPLTTALKIQITLPSTPFLPNPAALPSTTHALLSSNGAPLTAHLTRANTFLFPAVPPGSHLLTVFSRDVAFEHLRVDVSDTGAVEAVTTWIGNEWGNKGEIRGAGEGEVVSVECRAIGGRAYYLERPSFSVMSLFKNPMILIAVVTLGMVLGIPYLMDNLDPEMKAEFEEMQKKNKGMTTGASNLQNMDFTSDFASWMAGSKSAPKPEKQEKPKGIRG